MKRLKYAILIFVVLSGCSSLGPSDQTELGTQGSTQSQIHTNPTNTSSTGQIMPTETKTKDSTSTDVLVPTPTLTPTATATPTPTPAPQIDNPWDKETVIVTVINRSSSERNYDSLVKSAVSYWSKDRIESVGKYNVKFDYESESSSPDIRVDVRDTIEYCGYTYALDGFSGCAPTVHPNDDVDQVTMEISTDQNNLQFKNTVRHELGHVLGLNHSDQPKWLMSHGNTSGNILNASERRNPWNHSRNLKVAVRSEMNHSDKIRATLYDVAERYNGDDNYLNEIDNVTVVDKWYEADVVFQNDPPTLSIPVGYGSVLYTSGLDYDSDEEFEQYTGATVWLRDVDPNSAETAVGHWIGILLGNAEGELPEEYRW